MSNITVLVMADPAHPALKELDAIGAGVTVKIGKTAADLEDAAAEARVLFNWTGAKPEVHKVLQTAPKLEWIHAMYAGLDRSLFPELVEHPAPLTNGSGVFSQSLGEFIILGVLYSGQGRSPAHRGKDSTPVGCLRQHRDQHPDHRHRGAW